MNLPFQLSFPSLYPLVPLRPPRPFPIRKEKKWMGCIGERARISGVGPLISSTSSYSEGRSAVNKTTCDGLLQAGTADLVKMVAVLHKGLHPIGVIVIISQF